MTDEKLEEAGRLTLRVGKGDDGKFYACLHLMGENFTVGPFDTKQLCVKEFPTIVKLVTDVIEKHGFFAGIPIERKPNKDVS